MVAKAKTGFFVGLNHGFVVTKPQVAANAFKAKKSLSRGKLHKRVKAIREVVREICGLAPYERKMCELIRTGDSKKDKKSIKIAKKRLGSQKRANAKKAQMEAVIKATRKK